MEYGLIGARLGHSYSPEIHSKLGDYDYRLYEIDEATFRALLRARTFRGLNVTMPYKRIAFEECDVLSEAAREVGCVNTLVVRPDGALWGHNTDIGGFIAMAERAGVTLAGQKCAILGSGGASLTAQAACRRMGAREIVVVSRSGPVNYEALKREHRDVGALINTTPVGMYPNNGASPLTLSDFPRLNGVLDVIYNPDKTNLILEAEGRGIPCAGGLYMLVEQAREAAEYFTGHPISRDQRNRIYGDLRAEALNLVLVGMPGSGKSTIGRQLAREMGRTFIDCDEEIERRAGMSIPTIFAEKGEAVFRDMESAVIEDVCRERSRVIAMGGGAILRRGNVQAMRQNAAVLMLERDIDRLSRKGRPLSSSRHAVYELWAQRESLYRSASDAVIDNNGTLEDALSAAKEAFYEIARH